MNRDGVHRGIATNTTGKSSPSFFRQLESTTPYFFSNFVTPMENQTVKNTRKRIFRAYMQTVSTVVLIPGLERALKVMTSPAISRCRE